MRRITCDPRVLGGKPVVEGPPVLGADALL